MDSSVNHTMENRRAMRDRETHLTVNTGMLWNAIAPWVTLGIALLRLGAKNCEIVAQNFEQNFNAVFDSDTEQSSQSSSRQ